MPKKMEMPHDLVLEREVLGFFFCDGFATDPELIYSWANDAITLDDFHSELHRKIYSACLALWKERKYPGLTNTAARCEEMGADKVDAAMVISDAWELVPTNDMGFFRSKTERLKAFSQRRNSILAGKTLVERMKDPSENSFDLIEQARLALEEAEKKSVREDAYSDAETSLSAAFRSIESIHEGHRHALGMPSGLIPLDRLMGGFRRGNLTIIAGRPSVGKSAFALQCALYASRKNNHVAISSLEMTNTEIMLRALAQTARVNMQKFREGPMSDETIRSAREAANEIHLYPISFQDNAFRIEEILVGARERKNRHALDMLIVDYLQLARTSQKVERFEREIAQISGALKGFALRENVAVIALSQFSRRMEEGQIVREPRLSDLRESGAIEQDADVVLALHRTDQKDPRAVKCLVLKNRQGPIGEFELGFQPEIMTFEA